MTFDEGGFGRDALTVRQREVAALVARGLTNQQIAAEMVITVGTASNHVQETLRRLGLSSRSELATWANQHGLAAGQNRLLATLERLMEIVPQDLDSALDAATLTLAEALGCEKVDAFLYEVSTSTLVARGTSPTPPAASNTRLVCICSRLRMVGAWSRSFRRATRAEPARGPGHAGTARFTRGIGHPLGYQRAARGRRERRGVLSAVSTAAEFFTQGDLQFLVTVGRWVGMVAHRAELVDRSTSEAAATGRRAAAEELITILAHDFRNLLTPLRARVDLLARRARREAQPRYVRDAEELIGSVDRLDRLVRDLLDSARLKQGVFEFDARASRPR